MELEIQKVSLVLDNGVCWQILISFSDPSLNLPCFPLPNKLMVYDSCFFILGVFLLE